MGLWEDSLIIFMSDHGTNFADNINNIMGKPSYSMFPDLMNIPLILKLPGKEKPGKVLDDIVYNIDAVATLYDYTYPGNKRLEIDGNSLLPLISGSKKYRSRNYATSRYGNYLWYTDRDYWIIYDLDKKPYGNTFLKFEGNKTNPYKQFQDVYNKYPTTSHQ